MKGLYRLLLRGLDVETRDRYGEEMLEAFSNALADARRRSLAAWWGTAMAMLGDVLRRAAVDRAVAASRWSRRVRARRELAIGREWRSAVRWARRTPLQSGAIVVSVSLSVGGATGLFSVADALLLRPLPIRDPGSLVALVTTSGRHTVSHFTYAVWRAVRDSEVLDVVACRRDELEVRQPFPGTVSVLWVTGRFFDGLGVRPSIGRLIGPDDTRSERSVAVLGHRYWQTRFAGDPAVLGRTLTVGDVSLSVIGVAPEGFVGVDVDHRFDIAVPFEVESRIRPDSASDYAWGARILGRIDTADSLQGAIARLRAAQPSIRTAAANPGWIPEYKAEYLSEPLAFRPASAGLSSLGRSYGAVLAVLIGTLGLLVALAAANSASLLAARVLQRGADLGVRSALGATPLRNALPVALESLALTGAGSFVGCGVAALSSRLLLTTLGATPDAIERASPLELRVVAFASGLLVVVAAASALIPALRAARSDPLAALRARPPLARRGVAGRFLVANQVALSLALLILAGVALQTFAGLAGRPIGLDGYGLLVAQVRSEELHGWQAAEAVGRRAREQLAGRPGVEAVAVSWITPLGGRASMKSWECAGGNGEPTPDWVHFNAVSPGWFEAYGTRLVEGRPFRESDVAGAPGVAIVNQAFAAAYPCAGPLLGAVIHERNHPDPASGPPVTVVGVVQDVVYRSYREPAPPTLYRPFAQMLESGEEVWQPINVTVRQTNLDSVALHDLESTLSALSPAISVEVEPFEHRLDRALFKERLVAHLSIAIASLGGLLAILGSYATASFDAAARRRETAIRIALGASGPSILATAFGRVTGALTLGLTTGTALGFALARLAHGWLGAHAPASPAVYAAAVALLALATISAMGVATDRALRATPSRLLATE